MPAKQHTMHGRDHCPGGADPIPCLPPASGTDLEDLILALGPAAFWKLDEASGDIAHDSSGNDHHLTAPSGKLPPEWGQTAGPPGTTTAKWVDNDNRVTGDLVEFTDGFTAGAWVNVGTTPLFFDELVGQGLSSHSFDGWALAAMEATGKFAVLIGSGPAVLDANNPFDLDTWYFVAVVRDSGTWKLYIDGLLQAETLTTSPGTDEYGDNTWLGNDGYSAHTSYSRDVLLSYAFIADTVLTSTQLLAMYNAGTTPGGTAGSQVLLSDGAGGSTWAQVPTAAIEDEAVTPAKLEPGTDGQFLTTTGGAVAWSAAPASDPALDPTAWLPLTTVTGGVPELVWDGTDELIPTLVPI